VAGESEKVFDGEEPALADDGEDALMGVGLGEPCKLVSGLEGDADIGGTGEGDKGLEFGVSALASHGDVVEATISGANGLFNGMQAIENFHNFSLRGKKAGERRARALE
jgi:hypothetical protein